VVPAPPPYSAAGPATVGWSCCFGLAPPAEVERKGVRIELDEKEGVRIELGEKMNDPKQRFHMLDI
jgi:hypothetical protein